MATDLQTSPEQQSVTTLVTGIVHDAQELFKQQLTLFKTELQTDLRKAREATVALAAGVGILSVGGLMLCWALAFWLSSFFNWPTWGGFALVGGVLFVLGGVLVLVGRERFRSVNPLPEQSAEAMRENLEWKTKPR